MDTQPLVQSLIQAFRAVPDPRSTQGRRHPLPAILTLATAAMLSGARSLYAIAQWGRLQSPEFVHAMGFTRDKTPTVSTLHEVFSVLDAPAFELALQGWARRQWGEQPDRIAIDGKGLRGIHGEELPGARLISAYTDKAGLVLAQAGGQRQRA